MLVRVSLRTLYFHIVTFNFDLKPQPYTNSHREMKQRTTTPAHTDGSCRSFKLITENVDLKMKAISSKQTFVSAKSHIPAS